MLSPGQSLPVHTLRLCSCFKRILVSYKESTKNEICSMLPFYNEENEFSLFLPFYFHEAKNKLIVREPNPKKGLKTDFVAPCLPPPQIDGTSWYHMKVYDLICPTGVGVLLGGVSVTMVTRVEYIYQ